MKPNDVYLGKPEELQKWPDYPIKIKLISQVTGSHYANKGHWIAISYYVPNYARNYDYEYVQELRQIWTEDQIRSTFQVNNLV